MKSSILKLNKLNKMPKASSNTTKPAAKKTVKKPASKEVKTEKPVDETPVVETPVDETQDETTSAKKKTIPTFKFEGNPDDVQTQIDEMWKDMDEMQREVNAKFTLYKHFLRDMGRKFIAARKFEEKVKSKQENRKLRNHVAPIFKISPELAEFMGVDAEKGAARTDALGFISKYVKENKLNEGVEVDDGKGGTKVDKRMIQLDDKLGKLFPNLVDSEDHLMFTSILTHLKENDHIGEKMGTQASGTTTE